jgi:predicted AlkP superfamily pyrophosphatase or phosphodiesterase
MLSRTLIAAGALLALAHPSAAAPPLAPPPRLVLFITVDQLRGDMIPRFEARFADGGFRWLVEKGVHYTRAHYRHATTFTAVGHATLFTGGNPPEHGIAGNEWIDPASGERVSAVHDPAHPVLGSAPGARGGASPANLTSTTIGDEMIRASGGRALVFAVSGKERSAILSAGRHGTAYWYSTSAGGFVTSSYYMDDYPEWVRSWNAGAPVERFRGTAWDLLRPRETYLAAGGDDRACELPYGGLGATFPHPLADDARASLRASILYTPMGDEITADFACALLAAEALGDDDVADLLAVSLSCTDYVGHAFGPDSLEAEDNLLRLDATIARLLRAVDEHVGLDRTLVVLSSDHGIDAIPECRAEEAGRHIAQEFIAHGNAAIRNRFGVDADLVKEFWNPYLYLDEPLVRRLGLAPSEVERVLAETIMDLPGFAAAYTRTDLREGRLGDGAIERRVQRSFHPQRCGHVYLVQAPFWHLYHTPGANAAMHGSPYAYDTHVPVIVAVPGRGPAAVDRAVGPEDVAPTLARLLGVAPPSGCAGAPLAEVVGAVHSAP